MDRRHLFEKKPSAKWYHKCMTCKTRKMRAPMIKCVYCKKYRHSECTSSNDECQSPAAHGPDAEMLVADNTIETMTTPPDGIQQWYLDVKYDNDGNLSTGQESISELVERNPISANQSMTITEKWIVKESITIDKMRPIDKKTKNTNIDPPNIIVSPTITDQEASGSGVQTVEKTQNSDNSIPYNVENSTTSDIKTTEIGMNTSFIDEKSTNTDENTRITEKKTTDTGVNKSTVTEKAKQGDNNRPTTAEKLTTSDRKTTDIGVNTTFINEKSTTTDQKPTGTVVKMTNTNEKSTNTDVESSNTDENTINMNMKIPDSVEELITTDKKPINISIQTSTHIKESIHIEKKGNLADMMVTNDDWKTLTTEKKPIKTDKMTQTTEEKNIKTDEKTSDIEKKPSTNKKTPGTEKKPLNKKTTEEKTKKKDKKSPTTTNKKTSTTADKKTRTTSDKKMTSTVKKSPTTNDKSSTGIEKQTSITVEKLIANDKKRIFKCTKTLANEELSYVNRPSPCFSELKRTLVDAEQCTNDCITFENEEWSGNNVMTDRRSAQEAQPCNTLELYPCDSAEYFPSEVLQRQDCLITIRPKSCVQPNGYFMESMQMSNFDEQQSPTKPEYDGASSDSCAAMACYPDDEPDSARQIATRPADPVARTLPSDDDDFDVEEPCDQTVAVSRCVDSPVRRRMIGPVSAEESVVELAQLFPEKDDLQFCGFFFGGKTSLY